MSKKPPDARITRMQQLADLAGVSRATVSRALADSKLVNDQTKAAIRALALEHGYQINERARNFRLQKTNVIALILMLDIRSRQHMSDPFFLEMLGSIADGLADHEYDMLLAHAPIANVLDLRNSRPFSQSDGVIFVGQGEQHERLNALADAGKPIIVWGAPVPGKRYPMVGGDNERGGYLATRHLLDSGRRRIAFFGNVNLPEIGLRYAGYSKALGESGLPMSDMVALDVPFEMVRAHATISQLLESNVRFDAAVCSSDVIALSAIATLSEHGIHVPNDVAVVGYDDIAMAAYSTPPLTTITQSIPEAGRIMVDKLLALMAGDSVDDTTVRTELVVRRSCGAA